MPAAVTVEVGRLEIICGRYEDHFMLSFDLRRGLSPKRDDFLVLPRPL